MSYSATLRNPKLGTVIVKVNAVNVHLAKLSIIEMYPEHVLIGRVIPVRHM